MNGNGRVGAGRRDLGRPIIKALLGREQLPDDSPDTPGTIGLLGTRPRRQSDGGC